MVDAMSHGYRHPLDVDLADFAGDLVDAVQRESVEDHLSGCLLCRIKLRRLRDALGRPSGTQAAAQPQSDSRQRIATGAGMMIPQICITLSVRTSLRLVSCGQPETTSGFLSWSFEAGTSVRQLPR